MRMALPPEARSPSGLVLCPWLRDISPRRFSCGASWGAAWAAGGETGGLPGERLLRAAGRRVTAGNLARPARNTHCHPLSPAPEPEVGWMEGSVAGRGLWPRDRGTGRAGARLDKVTYVQSQVMATENHWAPCSNGP